MEKGFDHLRCPICGYELIYSEGTHDLCCTNNPYERISRDHSVREAPATYGPEEPGTGPCAKDEGHIYRAIYIRCGERASLRGIPRSPNRTRGFHSESVRTPFCPAVRKKGGAGTKEFPVRIPGLRQWKTRKNRRRAYSR